MKEITPTGDYEHMEDGALEQRYASEAASHPSALRLGVRRALALGGIAAVGTLAFFGVPKAIDVINSADQAAHNAATDRDIPSNPEALMRQAQETTEAAKAANVAREAAQSQP